MKQYGEMVSASSEKGTLRKQERQSKKWNVWVDNKRKCTQRKKENKTGEGQEPIRGTGVWGPSSSRLQKTVATETECGTMEVWIGASHPTIMAMSFGNWAEKLQPKNVPFCRCMYASMHQPSSMLIHVCPELLLYIETTITWGSVSAQPMSLWWTTMLQI